MVARIEGKILTSKGSGGFDWKMRGVIRNAVFDGM
jgi:hypothetical protein